MSTALIAGYGFTAWSIDRGLTERGYDVHGLRRDWDGATKNTFSAEQWTGNITDPYALAELPLEPDVVVNCVSAGDRGNQDRYRSVYLEGGKNLLEWSAERGASTLVYTGSSAVYGDRDGSVVDEDSKRRPETESAEVLVEAERMYETFDGDRPRTLVARLTGIYGPGRHRVIDRFLRGDITIRGQGKRYRNMIRREDVGTAVATLASENPDHDLYNVTDNKSVQEKAFFEWLSERLDRPVPAIKDDPIRRPHKQVSNGRLTEEFDFSLRYPTFKEGYERLLNTAPIR